MRHTIIVLALGLTVIAACQDSEKDGAAEAKDEKKSKKGAPEEAEKPKGPVFQTKMMGMTMTEALVEKDLTPMGLDGLVIQAPERAEIKPKSPRGFTLLAAGVNYSLTIDQRALDPAQAKEIFKIVDEEGEVLVDEADRVIFKRKSGSHLFQAETTVGDKKYTCGTVATAASFTRDQVDQMITSCKSIAKKGGA